MPAKTPPIAIIHAAVTDARSDERMVTIGLADDTILDAHAVVLATGVHDELPPVDGVADRWGKSVFNCPFCDGWEHRDQPVVVIDAAPGAEALADMLRSWTTAVTVVAASDVAVSALDALVKGTIGALHGVLFEESTDAPFFAGAGATGANVYAALIYAPRWFGTVGLEAQPTASVTDQGDSGIRISGVPVETPTKDDALGQFGVAGWKTSYGAKILREWVGLRIETGATA